MKLTSGNGRVRSTRIMGGRGIRRRYGSKGNILVGRILERIII